MSKSQNISGKLVFIKKEYIFNFDGNVLSVHIDDENEMRELLWTKIGETYAYCGVKALPSEYINGITDQTNKQIVFQIKPDSYSCNDIFALHGTTKISINVYRYMVISPDRKVDGTIIYCLSNYFHKFLGIVPEYKEVKDEQNENKLAEVEINKASLERNGHFSLDETEFKIHPDFKWVIGTGKFELTPELVITTDSILKLEHIWRIYRCFCRVIQFIFFRTNIFPDEFIIHTSNLKIEIFEREWGLPQEKPEELNSVLKNYVVKWGAICQHIDAIVNDFYADDNDINFFLYEKVQDRFMFDRTSISLDCAAFESIFSRVYPDVSLHDEKTAPIYEEAKEEIDKLILESTGKKKEIFKSLKKQVDHYSLEAKIQYAFKDNIERFNRFEEIIQGDIEKNYKMISHICATARNDIDHGNTGLIIDDRIAQSMQYLRALVLALYLKKWGLTNQEIEESIYTMFK